ncbi:SubName: Full=Uncharacterized protein {ECO:0000313/EMBL:CCA72592.1} [Serendipita indica DSM 11827]|uniref:G domain-containing protein n=1 Tax=Serendipita indica (strain DSM 11827) TaxID=1109443 RepID=G4TMQ0_SERID|nr:SubName: Full=Uncharacterized protein {ECO:0000313/EMBL:CCA72592.1} [Serendipita indica DSM 11827]CCA72592.1 hypothetical protein PIIN_06529 [Serendipita indica DSM 11827]
MAKLANVSKDDMIIAVMGCTGCGKTNFIAKASGHGAQYVNANLRPQPPNLRTFTTTHPTTGRRVVFVDTPGFDDTTVSDAETLSLIADWLILLKKQGARVSGVLYLHPITNNRISYPARENIETFVRLCGTEAMPNVILVTTMWDEIADKTMANNREEELKRDFWDRMLRDGGAAKRFMNTSESAWDVLRELPETPVSLQMEYELEKGGNRVHKTSAHKHLNSSMSRWIHDVKSVLFKKNTLR